VTVHYVSFDDTDNLNSPGTGHLLNDFLTALPGRFDFITRHQLFVHADVPFTSHNSAMVARLWSELSTEELIARAAAFLESHFADGADPGLCVADAARILSPELLVGWGYRAKKEVLSKEDACQLAARCGVHLSEHGGTGQGIVGALAAVGLRLGGQDGRVKGKAAVTTGLRTVAELLAESGFVRVVAFGEGELPPEAVVRVEEPRVKAVFQGFACTILTVPEGGVYRLLGKEQIKVF